MTVSNPIISSGNITASGTVNITGEVHVTMPPPPAEADDDSYRWLAEKRARFQVVAVMVFALAATNINAFIGGVWSSNEPKPFSHEPGQPILGSVSESHYRIFMGLNILAAALAVIIVLLTLTLNRWLRGARGWAAVLVLMSLIWLLFVVTMAVLYMDVTSVNKVNMGAFPAIVIIILGFLTIPILLYELYEFCSVACARCHGANP